MNDSTIRSGYRVVGYNTADGRLHNWYWPDLETANAFARQLCETTGNEFEVLKYLGSWRVATPPVEFVGANDAETAPPEEQP